MILLYCYSIYSSIIALQYLFLTTLIVNIVYDQASWTHFSLSCAGSIDICKRVYMCKGVANQTTLFNAFCVLSNTVVENISDASYEEVAH